MCFNPNRNLSTLHASESVQPLIKCPKCNSAMGPVTVASGMGKHITNHNRRYQICTSSGEICYFHWHDPPTPLERIPESVQTNFQLVKSITDTGSSASAKGHRAVDGLSDVFVNGSQAQEAPVVSMHDKSDSGIVQQGAGTAVSSSTPSGSGTSTHGGAPVPSKETFGERTYARPMTDTYGKAGTLHRQREAVRVHVNVVLFYLAAEEPLRLHLVVPSAGVIVPSEHSLIMDALSNAHLLEVFSADSAAQEWLRQSSSTEAILPPFRAGHVPRLLIRAAGFRDRDCADLSGELAHLRRIVAPTIAWPANTPLIRSPSPTPPLVSTLLSAYADSTTPTVAPATSLSAPSPSAAALPLTSNLARIARFPLRHTNDMVEVMEALNDIVPRDELASGFQKLLPHCAYSYSTFQKHRRLYRDAKARGILKVYSDAGHRDEGKWELVVLERLAAIGGGGAMTPSQTPQATPAADLGSTSSGVQALVGDDDDDDFELDMRTVSISYVRMLQDDRVIGIWSPTGVAPTQLLFSHDAQFPVHMGSRHRVTIATALRDDAIPESAYALKAIQVKEWPAWMEPLDRRRSPFIEAHRMAYLGLRAEVFVRLAYAHTVDISGFESNLSFSDFEVLKSYLLGDQAWEEHELQVHAQRYLQGGYNKVTEASPKLPERVGNTLNAFCHFIYESSGGHLAFTNLQCAYYPSSTKLVVYDALAHSNFTVDMDGEITDEEFVQKYLGNLGQAGLDLFVSNHVCTTMCSALGYSAFE
ncbi:hypothetical protein BKA70DRAFT_1221443 [Coprinopsis sp. MPI-PUGE-AT-0042]|nr:hypothetical protein BKA70DRAFT_1221443 [Coprinopsis sp. MPI-PUGE-AT-0042]